VRIDTVSRLKPLTPPLKVYSFTPAVIEVGLRLARDELSVGIGLNSGAVVAGNVGGAGRLESW
jgi:class 3 adenylate cyclase